MVAKLAKGIMLSSPAMVSALINKNIPCKIVDAFVLPPKEIFAELLTITCVTGKPPINPEKIFPNPCAFNSLLVGVTPLSGSILSVASTLNNVSRLATMASITAIFHTSGLYIALISGKVNCVKKSLRPDGTGRLTSCSFAKVKLSAPDANRLLNTIPKITTTIGP